METHDPFDEELKKLVRSVESAVPPGLEGKVRTAAETRRLQSKFWFSFLRRPLFLASISGAAAVLLAFLLLVPLFRGREETPITEIRTEFELADKNIKIIFVQKPDFPVLLTVI
jgi:hypothetical protein